MLAQGWAKGVPLQTRKARALKRTSTGDFGPIGTANKSSCSNMVLIKNLNPRRSPARCDSRVCEISAETSICDKKIKESSTIAVYGSMIRSLCFFSDQPAQRIPKTLGRMPETVLIPFLQAPLRSRSLLEGANAVLEIFDCALGDALIVNRKNGVISSLVNKGDFLAEWRGF